MIPGPPSGRTTAMNAGRFCTTFGAVIPPTRGDCRLPNLDFAILVREFVTLFVVIDPVGSLPVFYFATRGVPEALHWRFALRGVLVAGAVLFFFLVAGQVLLEGVGLRLGSFQIAGGIILFLFARTIIFGDAKPAREIEEAERDHMAGAVFPLAMPLIAGPGALATMILLSSQNNGDPMAILTINAAMAAVLALSLILFRAGGLLERALGHTGIVVVTRLLGILLAALSVQFVLDGIRDLGLIGA